MGIIETIQMLAIEEALEEGIEKAKKEVVINLLVKTDFDAAKIADLVDVDEQFVLQTLAEIKKQA